MPAPVTITVTGLTQQVARIASLQQKLNTMDNSAAVREVASVWRTNFAGEGSKVGAWAQLAPATQRTREYRGYAPEHPILKQTGSLEMSAIDFPAGFHGKQGSFAATGATAWISTGYGVVSINITGEKVKNQFGSSGDENDAIFQPGPTSWSMPARPFWFVDSEVEAAAVKGTRQSVDDVVSKI